jgi:predicted transcriptional regulator
MDKNVYARTMPLEAIEEKRRLAHELRKRGLTRAEIGELVEVHADTVGRWLKLDVKSPALRTPGRKKGVYLESEGGNRET